MDLAA
jgi:phenylacetaldehyde dehydrogenase